MPSASEYMKKTQGEDNLLKGSDLPVKVMQVTVKFAVVREAPEGFGSAFIVDLEQDCYGKESLPLNRTNVKALISLLGDDYAAWNGATVTLAKMMTKNPQTNTDTWGLRVIDAKLNMKRKASPSPSKPMFDQETIDFAEEVAPPPSSAPTPTSDDDVPF